MAGLYREEGLGEWKVAGLRVGCAACDKREVSGEEGVEGTESGMGMRGQGEAQPSKGSVG